MAASVSARDAASVNWSTNPQSGVNAFGDPIMRTVAFGSEHCPRGVTSILRLQEPAAR